MAVDKIAQIEWLITHRIPCSKCGLEHSCCSDGCLAYKNWKAKFDELAISDAVCDEARAVYHILDGLDTIQSITTDIQRQMNDISDEVKEKFIGGRLTIHNNHY